MSGSFFDVRGRGFRRRTSLSTAQDWVDQRCAPRPTVATPLADAIGLRLAAPFFAPHDWPDCDRAARDGFALAAADSLGAGSYNPIPVPLARAVSAGDPLPPGADAVLPFEAAFRQPGWVEAVEAVAPGAGVERRGAAAQAGASPLLATGRLLRPSDIGLLAAFGVASVMASPPPRVRVLLVGGPRSGAECLGAMLAALVQRDGGAPEVVGPLPADPALVAAALCGAGADLILPAGRTGVGADDVAPLALAQAGTLASHGVALRPGDSAGMGEAEGVPVILLPGEPMACWTVYEMLGGRAVRRMAGRTEETPLAAVTVVTARKLVSEIGCVDLYRVRVTADGRIEPVASPAIPGLAALARADGYVVIAADSEGVPEGATVTMRRFAP
ncbi:molybdopterin biosynthesis protein [Azospirillum cavernae]|uniref:Molybdopterin molybdenumtransferase n=1 Tax=Azospirillum cavernae TaxID=2320860 RepID=A0A418W401_9PROT|nr:molybdopterin-binding protein [Azospirillum cavernae]RJF84745.1 molybdopterin biosynthesis protein [Azospirillum cavernae]